MAARAGSGYLLAMTAQSLSSPSAPAGTGFVRPSRTLTSLAGRAIAGFDMIRAGDRILLGLSGGKDSLSLLHILHYFQQCAPVKLNSVLTWTRWR
jgi:hypothetical protein